MDARQLEQPGVVRRASAYLFRHPRLRLTGSVGPPGLWILLIYLVPLALLLVAAFWTLNVLTAQVEHTFTLSNFQNLYRDPVYRTITLRTLGMAVGVTVADLVLAFPLAYCAARLATPRLRTALLLAVVMPLWTNYLVRVFAWKTITSGDGPLNSLLALIGLHLDLSASNWAVWLTFTYLWLPFVTLPVYAALERVPGSLLEASGDLGGRGWMTFRRVVLPLALPGMVAGSIFSFGLTLGDYITPTLVGKDFFLGNAIYNFVGLARNLPQAAALAYIPLTIIALYLLAARALGAFEAL
jgi:putative spermidine/putrescine transport system permease protein